MAFISLATKWSFVYVKSVLFIFVYFLSHAVMAAFCILY